MHIVIKQFPVCKCPVYTFLLQSLSLDRLLEYEERRCTVKNENSETSIKSNPLCLLSTVYMLETDVTGKISSATDAHTNERKINDAIHNSFIIMLTAEVGQSSSVMRKNSRKWTHEVLGSWACGQGEGYLRVTEED